MGEVRPGLGVWGNLFQESVSVPLFEHNYSSVFTGSQEFALCHYFVLQLGKIWGGSLSVWGVVPMCISHSCNYSRVKVAVRKAARCRDMVQHPCMCGPRPDFVLLCDNLFPYFLYHPYILTIFVENFYCSLVSAPFVEHKLRNTVGLTCLVFS